MNALYTIKENKEIKRFESTEYRYIFNKLNGFFVRWGKTKEDDPTHCPFGPEIADLELTTSCNGVGGKLCSFCYKGNTPNGKYMSFETFKKVFEKINSTKTMTQIAFGVDSQCKTNPDIWKIMEYCRKNDIVPNVTVAELDDQIADNLVKYVGACAVSRYADKNICYNTVQKLSDRGLKQTNIHCMASVETFDMCMETLKDRLTDPRLSKLNAIVFLSLKQKGRGINHHCLPQEKFNSLVEFALKNKIGIGFDSCSQCKFLNSIQNRPDYKNLEMLAEPCESMLFSIYISVDGEVFPCSFCEGANDWKDGLNIVECNDFIKDVWNHKKMIDWRKGLLYNARNCPIYTI